MSCLVPYHRGIPKNSHVIYRLNCNTNTTLQGRRVSVTRHTMAMAVTSPPLLIADSERKLQSAYRDGWRDYILTAMTSMISNTIVRPHTLY